MFKQNIHLGRILGIPIGLNSTWFIAFVLVSLSLASQFGTAHPQWGFWGPAALGLIASLLFFSSVLLHELGHSVVALHYQVPVSSITLFVFGGVAQIGKEPERPLHELNIAIAGPLVSFALYGFSSAVLALSTGRMEAVAAVAASVANINLVLGAFNLIPGFPLDGGRIFRALVWRWTGSLDRASAVAGRTGELIAGGFIAAGVWQATVGGDLPNGMWIGFLGWFLLNAARMQMRYTRIHQVLGNLTAGDVMIGEVALDGGADVTPETPLETVLEKMAERGVTELPVRDHGRFVGVVTEGPMVRLLRGDESPVLPSRVR